MFVRPVVTELGCPELARRQAIREEAAAMSARRVEYAIESRARHAAQVERVRLSLLYVPESMTATDAVGGRS